MSIGFRLCFASLFAVVLVPLPSAIGQRGEFIEGLFRTLSEAQAERQRLEQQQRVPPAGPANPYGNPSGGTKTRSAPITISPSNQPRFTTQNQRRASVPSIKVQTRQAADFAGELVDFYLTVDQLADQMQTESSRNLSLRSLLPETYRVEADARTLIQSCNGIASIQTIAPGFSDLDARWRQLSFGIRSLSGRSNAINQAVSRADQLAKSMERRLSIGPQFDRVKLRDLMIVGSTYMGVIIDDLEIASIPRSDSQQLIHDCRLLRQQLLAEAEHVAAGSYDQVVSRFTDFVAKWGQFSARIYAIDDIHLHRRLDRIREVGNETYALLWIPPSSSSLDLVASSKRLERRVSSLLDQLTLRTMVSLDSREQIRMLEASRRLYDQCRRLEDAVSRSAPVNESRPIFASIDREWNSLRGSYLNLGTLQQGTISEIDQLAGQLREFYGVLPSGDAPMDVTRLVSTAAAIESGAEYLKADIDRFARYFSSGSYRNSITDAVRDLHRHSRELHDELSGRVDIRDAQREADRLIHAWEDLDRDMKQINRSGLPVQAVDHLIRHQQELVPHIAAVAVLLEHN